MAEHTTVKLARALSGIPGVPKAMIKLVIDGHYHDFLSPLTLPEFQLVADLRDLASRPATPRDSREMLRAVAKRVVNGEFGANEEEADAWAASPDGQRVFRIVQNDAAFTAMTRDLEATMPTHPGTLEGDTA